MFDRQIRRRVAKIAPFLALDEDPYPVVERRPHLLDPGRLHDVSDRYPYSTPARRRELHPQLGEGRDRRLPGHGDVLPRRAERSDRADAARKIFPDAVPAARARCRPTCASTCAIRRTSSQLQAAVYATYHMTNPAVFYNKEDQWEVPAIDSGGETRADGAVLHDHEAAGRDRTPSSSRCCRSRRGAATTSRRGWWRAATASTTASCSVFQFPKQKLVFGPRQVVARINQDQVISPQITLWNQQGSQVIQGTLMVIPIEESLIYVRPLYLRAQAGRIPELTRVIVAYQNQHRDGADARSRPRAAVRRGRCRRQRAADRSGRAGAPGTAAPGTAHRRTRRTCRTRRTWRRRTWPALRRATPTNARSPRSAPATGRSTAKRSSASARFSICLRRRP